MSTDLSMLAFATIFVFYLTIRSLLKVDVGVAKGTPEGCLYHSMLVLFYLNNIKPCDMISKPTWWPCLCRHGWRGWRRWWRTSLRASPRSPEHIIGVSIYKWLNQDSPQGQGPQHRAIPWCSCTLLAVQKQIVVAHWKKTQLRLSVLAFCCGIFLSFFLFLVYFVVL